MTTVEKCVYWAWAVTLLSICFGAMYQGASAQSVSWSTDKVLTPDHSDRFFTFNAAKNTFSWNGRDGKYYTIDFTKRTMSDGKETKLFSASEQARMTYFFQVLLVGYANESEDWFPDPARYQREMEQLDQLRKRLDELQPSPLPKEQRRGISQ